jgi:hypothetical protein
MKSLKLIVSGPEREPLPERPGLKKVQAPAIDKERHKIVIGQPGSQPGRPFLGLRNDPLDRLPPPIARPAFKVVHNRPEVCLVKTPRQYLDGMGPSFFT